MTLRTGNTLAAACLAVFGSLTFASLEAAGNERHERGVEVMDHLSGGAGQPVLEALRGALSTSSWRKTTRPA